MLSDARGRRSLLLLYGAEQQIRDLRDQLTARRKDVEAEQAVVFSASPDDATVRAALEAQNGAPLDGPLAIVTDRFGEIVQLWQGELPDAEAAIRMLQYVSILCEECFPPEWPPL